MIVKNRVRVPEAPKTEKFDDENVESMYIQSPWAKAFDVKKPIKHSKQSSIGSKVALMKELCGQPSMRNGLKTKYHQSDGSVLARPLQDHAVWPNNLGVANGAKRGQIRSEGGVEKSTSKKPLQRDLDAALALMELANEVPGLPRNGRKHSLNGMTGIKVPIGKLNNYQISHDHDPQVAGKKVKLIKTFQQSAVEDHMKGEDGANSLFPSSKAAYLAERKQKRRNVGNHFSLPQPTFMNVDVGEEEDNMYETYGLLEGHELTFRLGKVGRQNIDACVKDGCERLGALPVKCNWETKKRKRKVDASNMDVPVESDNVHSYSQMELNELPISSLKKRGSHKVSAKFGSLVGLTSFPPFSERRTMDDAVSETSPVEKQVMTSITPSIHTGFSFSIIHLLYAVRTAMVTPHVDDDALAFGTHFWKSNPKGIKWCHYHAKMGISNSEQMEEKNLPSLTIHEIVERVRANPGDPCILEAREQPIQDLIRGVLKIFSSKTAPLGAKGWKALTCFDKFSKTWSWTGPASINSDNIIEEEISPEAWGLPRRILVKLVDSFANWLKSSEETLRQIGSLPAPPVTSLQPTMDVKERLKGVKPQKSVSTISPSSEEVRAYFRKEEALRYLAPESVFSYTALDGRKSKVAPLRRCSGKPSTKGRDHFMLKPDRPPHITILCLVRDAAARLPGSAGTRADICILIKDSLYLVEDVSDAQLNQVVSGALDRLHYELDPCVQFDGDRKLWIYLHGEREDEDFEDDGTLSIKKQRS